MWIEDVNLRARRETKTTMVAAGSQLTFLAESTRVAVRIVWQFTAGMENPGPGSLGQAMIRVQGRNPAGLSVDLTVAGISQYQVSDELMAEVYGQLLQGAFLVVNNSALIDCIITEVFRR